jgi:hypothetical protein
MSSSGDDGGATRDVRLAQALVALADTLVDDFDVGDLLDDLARTCADLLPGTAAGLLLLDHGKPRVVAASGEDVRLLELFQVQCDQGPCLDAIRSGEAVTVDDISAAADRWPDFCAAAARTGYLTVHAVPMRLRKEVIGGLNVFRPDGPAISLAEQQIVQALAGIATLGILQQRSAQRSGMLAEQLQVALASRVVIEQAKGILAEQGKVGLEPAFVQLRRYARNNNLPLSQVARQVVDGRLAFEQLT